MNRIIYIDNLKEEQKQRYTSVDIKVLTPQEVFEETLVDTDALIVLCELNIDKEGNKINRTKFYGVKLVQEIRRKKFMGKVLFVSFMERKSITDYNGKNGIINTTGHSYLQLPVNPNKWNDFFKGIRKLTPLSYNDIILNYCDNHSIINGIKHDINSKKEPTSQYRGNLISSIIKICSLYNDIEQDEIINRFISDFPELTTTNINSAIDFVISFGNKIITEKPTENNNLVSISRPVDNWKVILLDDEINKDDILFKTMSQSGLTVLLANTVEEAESYWVEDNQLNHPKVMVVLVDYRLNKLKENVTVHQNKQGYDFLKQVSSSGKIIKTIVLSSMQKSFLLKSFNEYDISCEIFPKSVIDINTIGGANFICDEVIRLGNENWARIKNLPENSSWKYLKPSYIQIVLSNRYESIEKEICDKANKWIESYLNGIVNTDFGIATSPYTPKTNGNSLTHSNVEKLIFQNYKKATDFFINHPELINDKLSGKDINKIKKSKSLIDNVFKRIKESVLNDFNSVDSGSLQAENYLDSNIDKVILQFVGRRIAIWLAHKERKNIIEISKLLKNKKHYSSDAAKQVVNIGLAISTEDLKNSITLEERKWCIEHQYEYFSEWEINTIKDEKIIQSKLAVFKSIVLNYVDNSDFIKKYISNGDIIGSRNRTKYKINYINGNLQIEGIKELKAHINAFNSILTEENSSDYELDLRGFVLLIKNLLKEIRDITISEIKSMHSFLNTLHNPLFDDENYDDPRYTSFKTKENRLNEYIRKFEPWIYFKKKYADNTEFFSEIKENSIAAAKNNSPENNLEKFRKEKNDGTVIIEFYYMPYYYIYQISKDSKMKNLSTNEIIYWGITLWKEKRKDFFEFKKIVKDSELTSIDKANIETGKKYDHYDYQEEIDYYDDPVFSKIDSSIDIDSLNI